MIQLSILIFQIIIAVFIITFHTSGYRLGYNPIVSKVREIIDPVVAPFRKILPKTRFDIIYLVPAILIAVIVGFILTRTLLGAIVIGFSHFFLSTWFQVFFYTLLITVIASWLQTDPRQPVMQICLSCTEWLLAPIRKVVPTIAGLDFSPLIALFLIQIAQSWINSLITGSIMS